jgi:agarase
VTPVHEAPPAAGEFRAETTRGTEGFFRVAQDRHGRWWLLDPAGRGFFAKAVHGVHGTGNALAAAPAVDAAVLLRRLGFNAVGTGGDGFGRDDGLAYLATVDFCRTGPLLVAPGLRLPDVFAPDWPRVAAELAISTCPRQADARALLGWVTDDALGWAQPVKGGRPSLLQLCLSLEPGVATYHAAWEFALALHGGRLEALARAWGVPLANRQAVRELSRAETGIRTRGYLRDEARWTRELARRYFSVTAAAIRAADPNHLIFGCRFEGPIGAQVLAECVYPAVDVAMVDWSELPAGDTAIGPVLASNVSWVDEAFWQPLATRLASVSPARSPALPRLTTIERMLRRGRSALERAARHPAVIGYLWGRWQDDPGEQPPFARGLVHQNGAEAREHTELLAQFNARAETLRRSAARHS